MAKEIKVEAVEPKKRGPKPKPRDAEGNIIKEEAKVETKAVVNKSEPSEITEKDAIETASENLEELLETINEKLSDIETKTENLASESLDQLRSDVKILSEQAQKWSKWLKLHGITPQRFLEKYANHPARKFVEEL